MEGGRPLDAESIRNMKSLGASVEDTLPADAEARNIGDRPRFEWADPFLTFQCPCIRKDLGNSTLPASFVAPADYSSKF
jgi:hypothetical protein